MKNTGKVSEAKFENRIKALGGYVHRFEDAAALHGMNGHAVKVSRQPADYLICVNGRTLLAEVKSTSGTSFGFSMIAPHQIMAAKLITKAGGEHKFFVENLDTHLWYEVDITQIEQTMKAGKKSLKWNDMKLWNGI